jgi:hypothetical protein
VGLGSLIVVDLRRQYILAYTWETWGVAVCIVRGNNKTPTKTQEEVTMKKAKLLCGMVIAAVVLGTVVAPKASAQALSNKWFKMKYSGKGFVVDPTTKDSTKGTFSVPIFAQFVLTSPNNVSYTVHLWSDTDAGWTNASSPNITLISTNNDTFFVDTSFTVLGQGGNSVHGYHSPHIVIKTDKNGVFKSATYQGIGEITGGTIIDGAVTNNFIGSFSLTGTTTDTNKLPFTAP